MDSELVAQALEQVRALAGENDELRKQVAEHRQAHIAQLEANRELQWRLDAATDSAAAGDSASARDWKDVDAKLQLLLTENNVLEAHERQAVEELQAQQAAMRQLQLALGEAQTAAERAQSELRASETRCKSELARADRACELQREAERSCAASNTAISNLQRELEAAREEALHAHSETAGLRHEAERWHAQTAAGLAEATRREQMADAARLDMAAQLQDYKDRVRAFEADWAGTDRVVKQHLSSAEEMRKELVVNQEAVKRLEGGLVEANSALERAAVR